jgi:hypothetical protein
VPRIVASVRSPCIERTVKLPFRFVLLGSGILLAGCAVARTSYHVVTAPVRLFTGSSEQASEPPATTATTTTVATTSDVGAPGRPIVSSSPSPSPVRRTAETKRTASASPPPSSESTPKREAETKAPPPPAAEFPTAKPVPGKPGFVFDPFDPNGGYIDVSGYAPGSKVKDPTSKKIFIVP